MKKNKIVLIIIALCIILIILFVCKKMIIKINIEEYKMDEIIYIDINNDGNEEKIQINYMELDNKKMFEKEEFDININDNKYNFFTNQGENVISWSCVDINNDKQFEILVCVSDYSISPSYRKWNIYTYNNNKLTFAQKIYDGNLIEFNCITNKLHVRYSLHETEKLMHKNVYYDIKF